MACWEGILGGCEPMADPKCASATSQISVQYISGDMDSFEVTCESRISDLKRQVKEAKLWADDLEKELTSVSLIDPSGQELADDLMEEVIQRLKLEPLQVCFKIQQAECSSQLEAERLGFDLKNVQLIRVPTGIDRLLHHSFDGCRMRKLVLPDSLQTIEAMAFRRCQLLQQVTFGESLRSIGRAAFQGCCSLRRLELPEQLSHIEREAFIGCEALSEVKLPRFCGSIGQSAFESCTSLGEIEIPDTVTDLGPAVFRCCPLRTLKIPESITQIESCLCQDCYDLESVELPESLTIIGPAAFEDCGSLSKVNIPAAVQRIEDCAFEGTALKSVTVPQTATLVDAFPSRTTVVRVALPEKIWGTGGL